MKNSFLSIIFLTAMFASISSAQSVLDIIDTDIIVETLSDDGSGDDTGVRSSIPYEIIEVPPEMSDVGDEALLRGLDRLNGTVGSFRVKVGDTVQFERLEITLLACRYPQGDITSDAFAQMVIRDVREEEPRFIGWMFASSPAISALDHPRYDVWVISCQSSG